MSSAMDKFKKRYAENKAQREASGEGAEESEKETKEKVEEKAAEKTKEKVEEKSESKTESKSEEKTEEKVKEKSGEGSGKNVSAMKAKLRALREQQSSVIDEAKEKRPEVDNALKKQQAEQEKNQKKETARPKDATDCKACDGTGKSSKGGKCVPCAGRGWSKKPAEPAKTEDPPEEATKETVKKSDSDGPPWNAEPTKTQKESTVTTHYHYKVSGEVVKDGDKQEKLEVHTFESPPAQVAVEKALTVAPRQFESIRCSAHVSLPCYPEEVERALVAASRLAGEFVSKEITEAREAFGDS